jgi:hypothetical protein
MSIGSVQDSFLLSLSKKVYSQAMIFAEPDDTNMLKHLSNSGCMELFLKTINLMVATVKFGNDTKLAAHNKEYLKRIEYFDLSNDDAVRKVNIIANQISVLGLLQELLEEISFNQSNCEDNYIYQSTLEPEKGKIGEEYTAYLTYIVVDPVTEKREPKLVKMTLDGKNITVDYNFSFVNNVPTFTFTPQKKGLYEWTVNVYHYSSNGTLGIYPYRSKVKI